METKYIFIVGCGRTGTSLLLDILNRSEKICIAPESHFLVYRLGGLEEHGTQINSIGSLKDDNNVDKFVDYVYSNHKMPPMWQWLKRNIDQQIFRQRLLESDRSNRAVFYLLMQIYAEEVKGIPKNALILGEKTPGHLYMYQLYSNGFPKPRLFTLSETHEQLLPLEQKSLKRGKQG